MPLLSPLRSWAGSRNTGGSATKMTSYVPVMEIPDDGPLTWNEVEVALWAMKAGFQVYKVRKN